jgi:phage/plasmid-associated DNA primase
MIHNQFFSDMTASDLQNRVQDIIRIYGPPHYPTKRNPVGTLNERFWAAFYAALNEVLFENRENQYYQFNGKIHETRSPYLIMDQISNDIMVAAQNWSGYAALAELRNNRHTSGIHNCLKGMVQQQGIFDRRKPYIHVNNGVIDFSSGSPKLVGFSPELVSRNLVPIDYIAGVKCPKFLAELLAPLPEADRVLLQKLFGMFLSGMNFLQKIVILEGAAESGKSQLAIVARELIGDYNCSELRVGHLDDRFEIGRLLGKLLLIGADVSGDFLMHPSAYKLKGLTGGDLQTGERKNANAPFNFFGLFCVLITCNSRLITRIDGDRGAWLRRLILFLYDQRKQLKNIPNFGHKLVQDEGSGILNWALEGLLSLNDEVANNGDIILTPEQKQRTEALLDESEGLRHFVMNCIKADPQDDLTTDEIIEAYALYCADPCRGWIINTYLVQRQLPNVMLQLFHTVPNGNIVRNGKRARGYRNVTLI